MGYRLGTSCRFSTHNKKNHAHWKLWQLCNKCARKLHPEYYENLNFYLTK